MVHHPPQPDLVQGRDIVITGQQPWDVGIGSNCKNIAVEFARHNRVLYVNTPLDRNTAMKRRKDPQVMRRKEIIKGRIESIEQVSENIWVLTPACILESINWVSIKSLFEALNRINNKRFARSIAGAIKELGFRDIILFNDNDMFRSFHLKELLQPSLSIYYSRDYMLAVEYWKKHGAKMEPELIAKSDICVANSTYLANYCRQYNPRSYYVGQGCDLDIFTGGIGGNIPADMQNIPHPIIGYVGALQSIRLDIDLIAYMAKKKPEWSIVLVGPEDEQFKQSELHHVKNVHFLGSKQVNEIPAYINAFDVAMNPQLINEVTIGNYPRKIDEYLAMGKPVLATATDAMSVFEEYTYLGKTQEDYVILAGKALKEDEAALQQQRIAFASTHTWEHSVGEIYKAINNTGDTTLPQHIIILGMPRHDDDLESTSFMLSKELAKHYNVYYIDNPFTYRDYLRFQKTPKYEKRKNLFAKTSDGLLDIGIPGLKVIITPVLNSIHFLPEGWLYRQLLKMNEAIIRNRIRKVLAKEGINSYIYFNSFNFHYPKVMDGMSPALTVYQSLDPMVMDFDKKHGIKSEPIIVAESDLVVCSAKNLYEQFRKINPETYFLPNAADVMHSAKALDSSLPIHHFISAIPGPVIGYFGNIERRINYELLEEVALILKDFSFVLTGPYNDNYFPTSLKALPNIYLTGKVPYADMPSVIKGFDVAIIPFKTDEVSSSIFPLKLFEYLGAGKPLVATCFNPDLKLFTGDLVQYHDDAEAFAQAIKDALNDRDDLKQRRIAIAESNTWVHRTIELIRMMEAAFQKK
jgi:glycosyltransferase involved in cell wall biosynthesis